MLHGLRILLVEDEALIALELADIVEAASGQVVGPARTNREALALIERCQVDVAIVDINLADGEATPTVERLMGAGVPILICTAGVLPRPLRQAWPKLPLHPKPVSPDRLVAALSTLCPQPA